MTTRKPEIPPISVAFLLAQTGARAAQVFAGMLEPLGLAPADAGILRLLGVEPGMSQQELAGRLGMHASRLVAVIDALEERGLVARETNREDRRIYSLALTDAGRQTLGAIARAARAHEEAMCAGLNEAERAQLRGSLERIAERQGLAAGVHPGYSALRTPGREACPPGPERKARRP
ncbi:MAG TPA: MarR family transcriptional regulator [Acidobacteriaceae bacterium]|nr:MarR family transcriptional regulator [Acidobacteriaceae bacterium]HUB00581.1 MarR family transcriptional regulator [Terracidiphilus sp.]